MIELSPMRGSLTLVISGPGHPPAPCLGRPVERPPWPPQRCNGSPQAANAWQGVPSFRVAVHRRRSRAVSE